MKKVVLSVVVCLLVGVQFGFAQNTTVSDLLDELANDRYKGVVTRMNLSKEMGVMPMEGFEEMETYIPTEDEINMTLKAELAQKIYSLKAGGGYSNLMQVKDDGDHVDMYVKKVGDVNKELVIFVIEEDGDDIVIVRIKGNFNDQQLSELINQAGI